MIDLRSDTVTRPTPAMWEAMRTAELGDDMMGEDPTVNRLEQMMADLFGKEAAVLACSGTQSNQMGVRVHCIPGDELLINETGHIANFEGGAPAALSGVTVRTISAPDGRLDVEHLEGKVRNNDQHFCRTRLVCLENTTNLGGGRSYSLAQLLRVSEWARNHDLRIHLDGARLFNAIVAEGYSAQDVGHCFDTISICFSKGLGCPMGSILVGSAEQIRHARRIRKLFGGALRQAGIIAGAAIYAIENNVVRLSEDHSNARTLANGLASIDGIRILPETIETNLVFFDVDPAAGTAVQMAAALRHHGVLIGPMGGQRMRAVTHLDVTADDVQIAADAVEQCLKSGIRDFVSSGVGPYSK
ncbi:MAG: aminotransferase class I/II-fold pyridoxal phosphate-dependent enzyme [Planctomycetaceae bacterium]|nr:aminotransferase class I/II-fold pyridoxal phosphate-dependent enzyme [Planctomycetaceae bacterium]